MLIRHLMARVPWSSASQKLKVTSSGEPSSKILLIEFYSNVPDGHSEAIEYEVLNLEQQ